ncbi:MAG: EF-hand domain-containing protein [Candidatus Omnitrophota bacterium]
MLNYFKVVILLFIAVLFSCFNLFAEQQDEVDPITLEFQRMDADKDGYIVSEEMRMYEEQRFRELDKDKSGFIDSKELSSDKTKMYENADTDKDGKITKTESISQFTEYFKQMDKDNDNRITEEEYTDYWKGIYRF